MSRIENGKVSIETVPICAKEQMQLVKDVIQSDIDAKGLNFIEKMENLEDIYVFADALHVNRILMNILSNAVKFTPEGGTITFTLAERKLEHVGYAYYDFIIEDTGIGMSKDFINHIFEQFARERTSTVSKTQGTGLGMSISKSLVDLMGGEIKVESEINKGSKFTVTLEFKLATKEMVYGNASIEGINTNIDLKGMRVLLAEDNELNMQIANTILENLGFVVEVARDGREALSMIKEKDANYYNLVLMDIQMPIMNGYEATRAIRLLDDKIKANIPIIAMTANAFEEDKKNASSAGMNAHISKPIDVKILVKTIEEVLNKLKNTK
jgi:CheY-like chemotaxis protein